MNTTGNTTPARKSAGRTLWNLFLIAFALALPLGTYCVATFTFIGRRINWVAQQEFTGTGFDSYDTQALLFLIGPGLVPLLFLRFSEITKALIALGYTLGLTVYVGLVYLGWPLHPGKIINPQTPGFNAKDFSFEDYPMSGDVNHYALFFTLQTVLKPGMTEQEVDDILVKSGGADKTCGTADGKCRYAYSPIATRLRLPPRLPSSGYAVDIYYDKDRALADTSMDNLP